MFILVCGTYLSIIGRLVGVLGGLGVPALFGRVAGCHSGPLLWPSFLSKFIRWPLQVYCCGGGVRLWCWYVRRASGFRGVIGMSLIEREKL